MKAWVLHGINDLRLEEAPDPKPKDNEALIRVQWAGICSSDIQRVYHTGAYHYPIILGHEFAGVTEAGRRVGVFPLLPCFQCKSCQSGHYETCSDYSYIGSRRDGAFAQYVAAPEWNLIDLPDQMPLEQACLLEPAAVALHAVKKLALDCVNTAAVIGNGAIGSLMGRWLEVLGVPAVDLLGRGDSPSYGQYDACMEAVGSAQAFERCLELVRPNGQLVLVGNPAAEFEMGQGLYWKLLRKQVTVYGSWNSSYPGDWQEVVSNAHRLRLDELISHRYRFEELDQAFEMLYHRRERHKKVIIGNFDLGS